MTLPATTTLEPGVPVAGGRLIPAVLVTGLPKDPREAAAELRLPFSAFGPARGNAWQADFDLPRGSSWRIIPDRGAAIWFARDASPLLPPAPAAMSLPLDLRACIRRLAFIAGAWLAEARVFHEDAWSPPLAGSSALRLIETADDIAGVSGTWSDPTGRAVTGELHRDGRIWAETQAIAEHWLLVIAGLEGVSAE